MYRIMSPTNFVVHEKKDNKIHEARLT